MWCLRIKKKCVLTKRGRKITPGERIISLFNNENDAPGSSKKTKRFYEKKTENQNIWQCGDCADEWDEDDDDHQIVCDVCNQPYHLQFSGIQYTILEYWTIQLDEINFECEECERVLNDH